MASSLNLEDEARRRGLRVEVLEFGDTVESVQKASQLSGRPPSEIIKTLIVKLDEGYVVALVPGDLKLDLKKVKEVFKSKRAELAEPDEVLRVVGVPVGAVSPLLPSMAKLRFVMEAEALKREQVLVGGGSLNRLLKVSVKDLLRALNPLTASITK